MKVCVVTFPGSNCDLDLYYAFSQVVSVDTELVHSTATDLSTFDVIVLSGGFSYGDYLRSGAVAALTPVMTEVIRQAKRGKYILGICNGFQVLTEVGLLPGALIPNANLHFTCKVAPLRVMNANTVFSSCFGALERIYLPVAHAEGNYYCDDQTYRELVENRQIVFTYEGENFNGSVGKIAGIVNRQGNVLGLMPHPERAVERLLTNHLIYDAQVENPTLDGLRMLRSVTEAVNTQCNLLEAPRSST